MIAVCGLDCSECEAIFGLREKDGDLVSNRYYWIGRPKTPQLKRPEAYLWRMLEMSVW
jgi:hypothetical protein